MAAIAWLSAQGPREATSTALPVPKFAAVTNLVLTRCSMCHAKEPVWAGIPAAPNGIILDDADHIARAARLIELQAVRSNAMPPGNVTEMTPNERAILAAWLAAGAPRN
jgi:uncharacterized membrane protein